MADQNTVERAMSGLGSTIVRAGEMLKRARQDFGHAHEPRQRVMTTLLTCAAAIGVLALVGVRWGETSALDFVEAPYKNYRVENFEDPAVRDPDIVIIAIDQESLAYGDNPSFGADSHESERYAWPWPRHVYNKIIRYCREGGARVIVFDLIFSESGPNTNDPVRVIESGGRPVRVWLGDKAGDDLFVLEATAQEDVVIALGMSGTGRKTERRDELLKHYAATVEGTEADRLKERSAEKAKGLTPDTPIYGLLSGRPTATVMSDLDDYPPEQQLDEVKGYFTAMARRTPAFDSLRFWSLQPLPDPTLQGVGGVGAVNVRADRTDGVIREIPLLATANESNYRNLALETWRLYLLSHAREAQVSEDRQTTFGEQFGLTLDSNGLHVDGTVYKLANSLRDVPVHAEDGKLRYLGRELDVDAAGNFSLRYRTLLPVELDPAWQRADDEGKSAIADYYADNRVLTLYPTVSAAQVMFDWDKYAWRKEGYARERGKLQAAIEDKQWDVDDASGAEKERLQAELDALNNQLAEMPEAGPVNGFPPLDLGEPSSLVKDKVVFIAGSASGLGDQHATPFSPYMPGTYVVANAFDNVKNQDYMTPLPRWLGWLTGLLACVLAVLAVMFAGRLRNGLVLVLAMGAAAMLTSYLTFSYQVWMNTAFPLAGLVLGFSHGALAKALTEGRQRRQREAFAKQYMGKELVDYVIKNPGSLKLGGENREMTMFFNDVAGFTTVTETLGPNNPERLVELLNVYLERMTDLMLSTGGVIDKYIGDAIMCFWGAPIPQEDHAVRACRGALICRAELQRMQPLFADAVREIAPQLIKPDGTVLYARAGINSGVVTVGNMGSSKRFAYTVMGDAVNLAARLEPQCKDYGTDILIGEKTEAKVRGEFTLRRIDLMVVKGKTEPVQVFELMGDEQVPQFVKDLVKHFEAGIDLFRDRQFEAAIEAFKNADHHEAIQDEGAINPSRLYIQRCQDYLKNPPPAGWNGVVVKTSK